MQYDSQARNKPNISDCQQISMKGLHAFLEIIVWMGYKYMHRMKVYWTKYGLYHIHFYFNAMPHDCFLKILKYLHFMDNQNLPIQSREDPSYDKLWKIRQIFYVLNSKFSELYLPLQINNNNEHCGTQIYKLCDRLCTTYDIILGNRETWLAVIPTHGTIPELV
jgi:hypothetical protein